MRSAGIVFLFVAPKKEVVLRALKKEPCLVMPKKEPGVVPQGRLYVRRPVTPLPARTNRAEEYLHPTTQGHTKALAESSADD
jgi:hypothetical protein